MTISPIPIHRPHFLIGLDLGQAQDYTGMVIVERNSRTPDQYAEPLPAGPSTYAVRGIERLPLGTAYPAQVARVHSVVKALSEQRPKPTLVLIADFTGVGRPVADMLQDAGLDDLGCQLVLVTITGGDAVTRGAAHEYRVPKRDLASSVLVLLQSNRLKIAEALSLASVLTQELQGFRVKISLTGHDSYAAGADWRSAPHDDLVLALAMACWYGETVSGAGWDSMGYSGGDLIDFFREAGVG